jgi:hypothetical protein
MLPVKVNQAIYLHKQPHNQPHNPSQPHDEVLLIFRTVGLLRSIPESEGMHVAESQEVFSRVSG